MRKIASIGVAAAATLLFAPAVATAGGSGHTLAGGGGHSGKCVGTPSVPPEGTIYVIDSCFVPQEVTIQTGEILTWVMGAPNAPAELPHTVTFEEGFDSGNLAGKLPVRFNEPGTYQYFCAYHGTVGAGMYGVVVVEGAPVSTSAPAIEALGEEDVAAAAGQPVAEETIFEAAALGSDEPAVSLRLDGPVALLLLFVGLSLGLATSALIQVRRK